MPKRYCSIRKQILCSAFCLSKVLQWIPALDLAFITFSAYPLLPPSHIALHCNSNSLQRAEVPPPSLLHCITLQQQLSAMQQCSTSSSLPPTLHCITLQQCSALQQQQQEYFSNWAAAGAPDNYSCTKPHWRTICQELEWAANPSLSHSSTYLTYRVVHLVI